ncbi:hypothetical protein EKG37_21605 [Robertmurraya yapensis]|uniref:Uncharacterized protein n=1 Tax=Bacillus yapensis TaxID=2492960 RepID=A0A3S0I314_9BACI|nr:DUF5677 domain-containing protein [Bacillus yapensis]RTR26269.1 hypothetical protein EKG37_21605 [Bacillus yapensis]TKS93624.1 hypothetical protein FAR12_21610 [Bacillus yapensis]
MIIKFGVTNLGNIDKDLDKIGLIIRKQEEVFDLTIKELTKKYEVVPDYIVFAMLLFRKIIEKLDAVFILIENQSEKAAESICRDLFENHLYFKFIVDPKGNQKQRARAYHYSYLQDQLYLVNTLLSKKEDGRHIRRFMGIENRDGDLEKLEKERLRISNSLQREEFKNIKLEWDYLLKRKNINYPKWYSLFKGPRNIRELAARCGHLPEYLTLYNILSTQVHTTNVLHQIENINGVAFLKNLRIQDNPDLVLQFSRSLGTFSLLEYVNFVLPEQTESIRKWTISNIIK